MDEREKQSTYERSIGDVLSDLFRDGSQLLRQEVELAKTEMRENVSKLLRDSIGIAVGAVLALLGSLALLAAAVLALALVLPAWAAALIVGGVLFLIGIVTILMAVRALRKASVAPTKTMATVREDVRVVREKFA